MIRTLTCTLCLTHDCTLRCNYCYAGRKYAHAMSRETAKKAIDICADEAIRTGRGLDLSFFGGEPLLEWELLQWCYEYVQGLNRKFVVPPRFGITTNGTLLSERYLQWMEERDFLIGISIDGNDAMHNANRCYANGKGSHNDVAKALALLNTHPSVRSKAICVVTPNNVQHLSDGVTWIAQHFHKEIGLNIDYWSDWTDEQFNLLCTEYAK
ncbi:MAG: radical SAM protein, partial [Akkermansia sp.]|nr:radical SAM protein [Akkermansia sp.]